MSKQEFLSEELIAQIKGIQLRAKHLVTNTFAGEYKSTFKGRGMEFDEVREYTPGDDIRSIDWNVTARMNHPFVKIYRDERELTVIFVVDVSASSAFGTVNKFKNEISAEITALLAYMALRSNDKVGLIIFSDHVEHYIPPKKGRGHVWKLIREILTYKSQARKTDLAVPLEFLNQVIKHKSIAFLISDFQDEGYKKIVQTTAKHHELIAISVTDPKEMEIPNIGYIELEDAETGEFILVNSADFSLRSGYKMHSAKNLKEQKNFFQSSGIDYININTGESYIRPIAEFFRKRNKIAGR
ncbi:MAG TPA: DUF58 domain-containing protein [Bacteriovoracaceae bacterium]|nr:DUF58 domain-containing protein [Bacteriovoracaceae bacterium]